MSVRNQLVARQHAGRYQPGQADAGYEFWRDAGRDAALVWVGLCSYRPQDIPVLRYAYLSGEINSRNIRISVAVEVMMLRLIALIGGQGVVRQAEFRSAGHETYRQLCSLEAARQLEPGMFDVLDAFYADPGMTDEIAVYNALEAARAMQYVGEETSIDILCEVIMEWNTNTHEAQSYAATRLWQLFVGTGSLVARALGIVIVERGYFIEGTRPEEYADVEVEHA